MPNLSKKEWLNLFEVSVWKSNGRAYACMLKLAEELRKKTPRQQPFRCVCGAVLHDPFAPGVVEIHQPHVQAAALDRK